MPFFILLCTAGGYICFSIRRPCLGRSSQPFEVLSERITIVASPIMNVRVAQIQ